MDPASPGGEPEGDHPSVGRRRGGRRGAGWERLDPASPRGVHGRDRDGYRGPLAQRTIHQIKTAGDSSRPTTNGAVAAQTATWGEPIRNVRIWKRQRSTAHPTASVRLTWAMTPPPTAGAEMEDMDGLHAVAALDVSGPGRLDVDPRHASSLSAAVASASDLGFRDRLRQARPAPVASVSTDEGSFYRPLNAGLRFSAKARGPSLASSLASMRA